MFKPKIPFGERPKNFRKMRYKCGDGKCFEESLRCRLGALDHLFPGNNGMSDTDGFCAINGHFLFLEWKTGGGIRQQPALMQLSHAGLVIAAWGAVELMKPTQWVAWRRGEEIRRDETDGACRSFDELIWRWGLWAEKTPNEQMRDWLMDYAKACQEKYGEVIPEWLVSA